jgi:small subunit ribosomal protein S16
MLAIRMQRTGRKGHAMFRVIVQDARRTPTSGKVVAALGSYDPHGKTTILDKEKASFYLDHGAQPSDRVARLLKAEGVKLPDWVKLEADKARNVRNADKRRSTRPEEPKAEEPAEAPAAPAEPETPATEESAPEAGAPGSESVAEADADEKVAETEVEVDAEVEKISEEADTESEAPSEEASVEAEPKVEEHAEETEAAKEATEKK